MKTLLKISAICLCALFAWAACTKDETKLYYTGGTPPVLTTYAEDSLSFVNAEKTVLTLTWTNPNYTFTTGASSLNVTYLLQIDTAGSGFSNPNLKVISVSQDLTYSFTASALNDIMLNQLNLLPNRQHTLEMRVISSIGNDSAQITSNTVQYVTTPYVIPPKVTPPFTGQLFIIGKGITGTDAGWNNPVDEGQFEFTQTDSLHYTLTTTLYAGGEYLFLPKNGDWSNKYACEKTATQPVTGGDFGYNFPSNFPAVTVTGSYRIDVDFQKGKYAVVKL